MIRGWVGKVQGAGGGGEVGRGEGGEKGFALLHSCGYSVQV